MPELLITDMKGSVLNILTGLITVCMSSCYYDKGDKLYPATGACDTALITYNQHIAPVLNENCVSCHQASVISGNIRLDNFQEASAAANSGKLLPAVKHLSGGGKNMPPGGKLSDCNILKIETWINRGLPQ